MTSGAGKNLLEGFRVLDLSRLAPGPNATRLLADMGMDVIMVEEPSPRGGFHRDTLTPVGVTKDEERRWAAYNALARNKRSIALDLRQPDGQDILHRLVRSADVVVEGYRPGVTRRLGADYPTLSAINPQLVYCSISLVGQDGPYRDLAGHDAQAQAISGLTALGNGADGSPHYAGFAVADHGGAVHAVVAILAALLGRPALGRGQYIDLAMSDTLTSFLPFYSSNYFRDGAIPARGPDWIHQLTVLKCRDGKFLSTQNAETYFWERFCKVIGREDLIPHAHPSSPGYRHAVEEVRKVMLTRDRDDWLEALRAADTCVAPVLELPEAFEDPHNRARNTVWDLDHPTEGQVRQIGFPIKFSETPASFHSFAPAIGEHTESLLTELGYSKDEIDGLVRKGSAVIAR